MKIKHKIYFRLNLMSIFFMIVSFISVTMAWFAYSGLVTVSTEVNVKAWYIELEKDGTVVSNSVSISLADIYPGMETVTETIIIKNLGDSDAEVKYEIASARILGDEADNYVIDGGDVTSQYIENILANQYPFKISINLDKNYVLTKSEPALFEISISWPLDSGDDTIDSFWGTEAYKFYQSEEEKKVLNPDYQIRPSIGIIINLIAEQYLNE